MHILRSLLNLKPEGENRLLGITDVDLFIPMLSFVLGQAQLGGPTAVVSVARLRQEFYGLPPDLPLLRARAVKEAVHEIGHTFGLTHCADSTLSDVTFKSCATGGREGRDPVLQVSCGVSRHIKTIADTGCGFRRRGIRTMTTHWHIMVVDDEEVMRESLAAWLREDGYSVDTAAAGAEAVRSGPRAGLCDLLR